MYFSGRLAQLLRSSSSRSSFKGNVTILHEPAAATHANRLRKGMERNMGQRCDISVPTAVEAMVRRREALDGSPFVLLLQTRGVLSQPWALAAAYYAALSSIPIVCVVVNGSGYDFDGAKQHLEQLSERLDAASLEQLTAVLSQLSPPQDVSQLQQSLASLIPHIISVVYNPEGSDNKLAATVRDIRDKQGILKGSSTRRLLRSTHRSTRDLLKGLNKGLTRQMSPRRILAIQGSHVDLVVASGPLGVDLKQRGSHVVVSSVEPGSIAEGLGVDVGNVVEAVNGRSVSGLKKDEVMEMIRATQQPWKLRLQVLADQSGRLSRFAESSCNRLSRLSLQSKSMSPRRSRKAYFTSSVTSDNSEIELGI